MTLSTEMQTAMFSQETDDGLLVLLTITHDDLSTPIRVVANGEDITSRGNSFTAFPFEILLPSDEPDSPPNAQLTIDNVSREIGQAIRTISSAAAVLIEVIRLKSLDTVELSFPSLNLRNVRFDAGKVTGDLTSEDLQIEPYPADTFNPSFFPGMF